MPNARITDIACLPIFNEISSADCTLLFECLGIRIRRFKKDDYIVLHNELEGNAGIVIEGSVNIYKEDIWGNRTLISYQKEGGLFGENLPLKKTDREIETLSLSFVCTSPSLVLFLPIKRILHPCSQSCPFHHTLAQNLFNMVADKNRNLMEKIEIISRGSVRDKILSYLSMEARHQRSSSIDIPLTRTELAEYLCVNRSALSRELSALKNEGIIDFRKNHFDIHVSRVF